MVYLAYNLSNRLTINNDVNSYILPHILLYFF